MSKRSNHGAAFKARVVLPALKGERAVSQLASACKVHPTMIHQWSEPLCANGPSPVAKSVASNLLARGSKPRTGKG